MSMEVEKPLFRRKGYEVSDLSYARETQGNGNSKRRKFDRASESSDSKESGWSLTERVPSPTGSASFSATPSFQESQPGLFSSFPFSPPNVAQSWSFEPLPSPAENPFSEPVFSDPGIQERVETQEDLARGSNPEPIERPEEKRSFKSIVVAVFVAALAIFGFSGNQPAAAQDSSLVLNELPVPDIRAELTLSEYAVQSIQPGFESSNEGIEDLLARSELEERDQALVVAAENGNLELVRVLCGRGCISDEGAARALDEAAKSGHTDIADEILRKSDLSEEQCLRSLQTASDNSHPLFTSFLAHYLYFRRMANRFTI